MWDRIERRLSPMSKVMSAGDYRRVAGAPAFTAGRTRLFGEQINYSNGEGFLHSVREIFYDEVYRFEASSTAPLIIDAGANIGLSIVYFKRLYPNCRIVAFEPDPDIFALLERNVASHRYSGVELRRAAAWIEETTLSFFAEGSLAGSTEVDFLGKGDVRTVPAERLKTLIEGRDVDFLKIDIEGAENEVLPDLAPALGRVKSLFFEYHSIPDRPQRLDQLLSVVRDAGFRYVINGPHGPRHPFVERIGKGFDLQLNVSCYRP